MWWSVAWADERVLVGAESEEGPAVHAVALATGAPPWHVQPVRVEDLSVVLVGGEVVNPCAAPTTNAQVLESYRNAVELDAVAESKLALQHLDTAVAALGCLSEPVERSLASALHAKLARVRVDLADETGARAAWDAARRFDPELRWSPAWDPRYRASFDAPPGGAPGTLVVTPAEAMVLVDGRPARGTAPLTAGPHLLQAAGSPTRSRVVVVDGAEVRVTVLAGAGLDGLGADDRALLAAPLADAGVAWAWSGGELLDVGRAWREVTLPPDPARRRQLGTGLMGAGAGALVGGAAFVGIGAVGMAANRDASADEGRADLQAERLEAFHAARGELVAGVSLVAAGVVAGGVGVAILPRGAGAELRLTW